MKARSIAAVFAAIALMSGCAKKVRPRPAIPVPLGYTETGVASWYGDPYHGRRAANGEIYDMEKFTAAHRTHPFGTWVRVESLENRKSVEVRITDRGPFVKDRCIDLSRAAARVIGMIGPGTARVRLVVIAPPEVPAETEAPVVAATREAAEEPAPAEGPAQAEADLFAVQVGAFRDRDRAERLRVRMESLYGKARLAERDGSPVLWRVLVGMEPSVESAQALADRLREETGSAFVVRLDPPRP